MNITVFGATGLVGKRVIELGLAHGYNMTAFGRNVDSLIDKDARNEHFRAIKGYVFDASDVSKAVKGADAVISVLGGSIDGTDKSRSLGMKNIIQQMEKNGVKRIVALGGMGVLDDANGNYLLEAPDYPEEYLAVGREHLQAYEFLKASSLNWSFVGAPDILDAKETGHYVTSANHVPEPNNYKIAAGDLAEFMLREAGEDQYVNDRVGISAM